MERELHAKYKEFRDCGKHPFDPLDLGSDDDFEDEKLRKAGRPKSPILDRARASYWAWTVKGQAGKSFAELERELALRQFQKRDGGGFEQPNAWLKYAKGERCPLPPSESRNSPVLLAEKRYPGTRAIYDSIAWELMYDSKTPPEKPFQLTSRISPFVLNKINPKHIQKKDRYRILLSPEGISSLVLMRHLDAFGLLLMQWRNHDSDRLDIPLVYLTRTWLLFSFQWMEPFKTCRKLIAQLIHRNLPELGLLNGPGGLDPQKTHEERARDAYMAALLGGVRIELPSELFQDVSRNC